LAGCHTSQTLNEAACLENNQCTILTGELDYRDTTEGNLFLLRNNDNKKRVCVALGKVSERKAKN